MDTPDPSTQLEVTLRHPSFGEFAFRCEPDQLGNVAGDMLAKAHAEHDRQQKLAALDQRQLELVAEIGDIDKRIDAATLLADDARIKQEQAARSACEDKIAALAAGRASI